MVGKMRNKEELEICRAAELWPCPASSVFFVVVWPIVEYRNVYAFNKRLREVTPGRVYRCGEMNAAGFAETVAASRFAQSSTSRMIIPIPTSP